MKGTETALFGGWQRELEQYEQYEDAAAVGHRRCLSLAFALPFFA